MRLIGKLGTPKKPAAYKGRVFRNALPDLHSIANERPDDRLTRLQQSEIEPKPTTEPDQTDDTGTVKNPILKDQGKKSLEELLLASKPEPKPEILVANEPALDAAEPQPEAEPESTTKPKRLFSLRLPFRRGTKAAAPDLDQIADKPDKAEVTQPAEPTIIPEIPDKTIKAAAAKSKSKKAVIPKQSKAKAKAATKLLTESETGSISDQPDTATTEHDQLDQLEQHKPHKPRLRPLRAAGKRLKQIKAPTIRLPHIRLPRVQSPKVPNFRRAPKPVPTTVPAAATTAGKPVPVVVHSRATILITATIPLSIVATQVTLYIQPVAGVYVNAAALAYLTGLALLQARYRALCIVVSLIPAGTMVLLSLPTTTAFNRTASLYGFLLVFGLIYRHLVVFATNDGASASSTRLGLRGYARQLPTMIVAGQLFGLIGYGLLRSHYDFHDTLTPIVAGSAIIFALAEEIVFRGLIQQQARQIIKPFAAGALSAVIFAAMAIGQGMPWAPIFALFLGAGLSYIYNRKPNILLTWIVNVACKLTFLGLLSAISQ